ncbi:CBS domain-containing protein [Desulfopila sp. IMCC35008]|uniref:CBS domain-containing protein n=1 Tax=Desulfopila sp. IMCC35008 TaxID=2653858 RepID=UPI0013CFFECF|nr:CBS domain-containing protein [Desulfopila sp. IMCC35008]
MIENKQLEETLNSANAFHLSDDDVIGAMKEIEGYLDISVQDFRELYTRAMKLARERFLRSTPVREIMQVDVATITAAAKLEEIIGTLADNSVSGLPVINDAEQPVGVVSEKDIFNKLSGKDGASFWQVLSGCLHSNKCLMKSITSVTANEIMTAPAVTIKETASVRDALELYRVTKINRLPVIDDEGKLAGIVTRTDILEAHLEYEDQ